MILEPPGTSTTLPNGTARQTRPRTAVWRRRWVLLIVLAVLLIAAVVLAVSRSASTPPVAPTKPTSAPLIANGQILPQRQARVGTQGGGDGEQGKQRAGHLSNLRSDGVRGPACAIDRLVSLAVPTRIRDWDPRRMRGDLETAEPRRPGFP